MQHDKGPVYPATFFGLAQFTKLKEFPSRLNKQCIIFSSADNEKIEVMKINFLLEIFDD